MQRTHRPDSLHRLSSAEEVEAVVGRPAAIVRRLRGVPPHLALLIDVEDAEVRARATITDDAALLETMARPPIRPSPEAYPPG